MEFSRPEYWSGKAFSPGDFPLYVYMAFFLTYSPTDGRFGRFSLLVIVNNAAMNRSVLTSRPESFFSSFAEVAGS